MQHRGMALSSPLDHPHGPTALEEGSFFTSLHHSSKSSTGYWSSGISGRAALFKRSSKATHDVPSNCSHCVSRSHISDQKLENSCAISVAVTAVNEISNCLAQEVDPHCDERKLFCSPGGQVPTLPNLSLANFGISLCSSSDKAVQLIQDLESKQSRMHFPSDWNLRQSFRMLGSDQSVRRLAKIIILINHQMMLETFCTKFVLSPTCMQAIMFSDLVSHEQIVNVREIQSNYWHCFEGRNPFLQELP